MKVIATHPAIGRLYVPLCLMTAAALAVFTLAGITALAGSQLRAGASSAAEPAGEPAQIRANAVEAFRDGRYAEAYGRFLTLADEGDATSAQIALAMLRNGPVLFGSDWSATPGQQAHWNTLVIDMARRQAPITGGEGRE
jgi:hypothetical protein